MKKNPQVMMLLSFCFAISSCHHVGQEKASPIGVNRQYEGEFTYPTEYSQPTQALLGEYVLTYDKEIIPEEWKLLGTDRGGDTWGEPSTQCKVMLTAVLDEGRPPLDVAIAITSSLGNGLIELSVPETLDDGSVAQTSFIISPINAAGRVAVKVCANSDGAYLALLILCPAENGILIPNYTETFLVDSCVRKT